MVIRIALTFDRVKLVIDLGKVAFKELDELLFAVEELFLLSDSQECVLKIVI